MDDAFDSDYRYSQYEDIYHEREEPCAGDPLTWEEELREARSDYPHRHSWVGKRPKEQKEEAA